MFRVLNDFIDKMIEKPLDKGQDVEKDVVKIVGHSDIVDFYNKHETAFDERKDLRKSLIDSILVNVSTTTPNEIFRVGLMFDDGSGRFYFMQ